MLPVNYDARSTQRELDKLKNEVDRVDALAVGPTGPAGPAGPQGAAGLQGPAGLGAVDVLDEDDMVSNADNKVATQQSIKAYVDSKQDLVFKPSDYGAVGDNGTTDDIVAIKAMITAVQSNGGGTVDLEEKVYGVSETVAFGVPIRLVCGKKAGFKAKNSISTFSEITGRGGDTQSNPDGTGNYRVLFDTDGMAYSSFEGLFELSSVGGTSAMGGEVNYVHNLIAMTQQDGTGPVQALNGYFESLYVTKLHAAFFQAEKDYSPPSGPVLPYTRTWFARLEIVKCYQAWNFLHVNGFDDCAVGVLRVNKCAEDAYAKAFDLNCVEAFLAGGKATATGTFNTTATSTAFTTSTTGVVSVGDRVLVKGAETYGQGFCTKIATYSGTAGTFEDVCPVTTTNAEFIFAAGGFLMDRATFVCNKLYLEGAYQKLLHFTRQGTLGAQTLKFSTGEFGCYKGRPIVFEHINSVCNIDSIPQSEQGVNGNPLIETGLGKLIQSYVYYGLRKFTDIQIPPQEISGELPSESNTFDFYPEHKGTVTLMMDKTSVDGYGIKPIEVGRTIYDTAGFAGGIREWSTSNSQLTVNYSDATVKVSGDIGGPELILDNARGSGLSVESFGAVGDGVTDDTAALQAAFSYGNSTRTKITMQGKTYLYSGLLATITDSVAIEGAGDGTILLKSDNYTGAAFVIENTFGQIPEFYPNGAGDQDLAPDLTRVKSPSFSKFSIIGKSRASAGFGFDFKDRNDMVSIQDVNCFNLKGSAFRFTGTFGNLRESNIRRLVVRMCGDENHPAVDLKMPSFSNTGVEGSLDETTNLTRWEIKGTGDNFSGMADSRKRIRVQGSRLDGGTQEWEIGSIISDTVVELTVNIESTNPETGENYGQIPRDSQPDPQPIPAPATFYRDVDGLNHIAFNDCQIVGCYGTYLRLSHDRVNFFRRVVFNNLMVHGSNKKYQDGAQQGPAGDLILIEGGIGSVDFRGLRINNNEVDKGVTPNVLYAGMRVKAGQIITQDIPDRIWINDLDMLNLNNDGEAMFVIEKVKNMSVNGTVAASSQSGTELKVTADAVTVGLDYNVIAGTSKNIRNVGVLPAFSIDDSIADKVFITENNRNQGFVTVKDYGAVGNGIEDDTAAFARAFSSGSTIYVPKGTYLLPNWTTVVRTTKLTLKGEGIIRGVGNAHTFIDPRNDMDISGVSFEGFAYVLKNVFNESTAGINNLRFHNVIVKDCGGGINLERPVSNLLVTGCDFRNITANKPIRIGKDDISAQNTWKNLTITDNKFRSISTVSGTDCNAILAYGRQVVISNNVFTTIGAAGTFEFFSGDGSATVFTVTESGLNEGQCTLYLDDVEQINTDDTTLWTLNGTTKQLTFTTAPVSGTNNIKFYYAGESAAIYTKARFTTITGNTISGMGKLPSGTLTLNVNQIYGINVKGRGRGDTEKVNGFNVAVTGNTLVGESGYGSGIRIQNDCVNVTGNNVERFRWGINGNTAIHDDSNISNNNIYHCSQYGINFIQSGTNAIMQGNNITGVDVGSGVYEPLIAIHVKAHSDTENYNISNNSISGCKKGIKISSSSTAGAEISNVLITNNTLSNVTGNGIEFADCNTITVDNNQYKGEVTNQFIRPVSPNQNVTLRDSRTKSYNTGVAVTLQTWNTSIVDQAVRVTASVTAKQGDAEFAAYKITGLFKVSRETVNGVLVITLAQVGSTATEYAITSSGAASWGGVSFLTFHGDLLLRVQGTSATPDTQWSAKTEYVSITDASF